MPAIASKGSGDIVEIPADAVEDKIRGGFLGPVLGVLNGLEDEMKYIAEPGNVRGMPRPFRTAAGPATTRR